MHDRVPDPRHKPRAGEAQRLLPAQRPHEVRSSGHAVDLSPRYCLCTGDPVLMQTKLEFHDPDTGPN